MPVEHAGAKDCGDVRPWQKEYRQKGEGLHGGTVAARRGGHFGVEAVVDLGDDAIELRHQSIRVSSHRSTDMAPKRMDLRRSYPHEYSPSSKRYAA